MRNILVVSSCTKGKKKEKDRASELYSGEQHLLVKKGVKLLREKNIVDWYIISAKYGLIHEDEIVEPYNKSFTGLSKKEIRELSKKLRIKKKLSEVIEEKSYEKAFFLLGEQYLTSIENFLKGVPPYSVFFAAREIDGAETMPCGIKEAKKYQRSVISLKGYLFVEYIKKEMR
ncbi:MAG: hypothetical protein U9N35_06035 [Euryarchaeota archaeon]|nr:hypothetical protein [Euryarchaeota archaeon]